MQAIRLNAFRAALCGLLLAGACGGNETDAMVTVTIDMRCGAEASCPARFECTAETEHGPPITLCESHDPAATCPPGFEMTVGYGQTFCTRRAAAGSHTSHAASSTVRNRSPGLATEGRDLHAF